MSTRWEPGENLAAFVAAQAEMTRLSGVLVNELEAWLDMHSYGEERAMALLVIQKGRVQATFTNPWNGRWMQNGNKDNGWTTHQLATRYWDCTFEAGADGVIRCTMAEDRVLA